MRHPPLDNYLPSRRIAALWTIGTTLLLIPAATVNGDNQLSFSNLKREKSQAKEQPDSYMAGKQEKEEIVGSSGPISLSNHPCSFYDSLVQREDNK